jgi:hypothetical protein
VRIHRRHLDQAILGELLCAFYENAFELVEQGGAGVVGPELEATAQAVRSANLADTDQIGARPWRRRRGGQAVTFLR